MQTLQKHWIWVGVALALAVPLALWWIIIPWKYIKTPESFSALFTALTFAFLLLSLWLTTKANQNTAKLTAMNLRMQYLLVWLKENEDEYKHSKELLDIAGYTLSWKAAKIILCRVVGDEKEEIENPDGETYEVAKAYSYCADYLPKSFELEDITTEQSAYLRQ